LKGESAIVKYRWILLGAVTAAGLFLDLGTKYLAYTRLEEHVPVEVIGRYLMWKLVYNDGAVFGTNIAALLPWLPPAVFFVTFMLLAIGFLLFYFKMLKKDEVLLHIGMMLVMPGALGNLHDRIAYGDKGVVDFILMGIPPNHYWFIYNVADIFVTVGVSIMVIYFIVESFKKQVKGDDGQQEVQAKEGAQD